jgi:hypothetical protein
VLEAHPEAARERDEYGYLPLHSALLNRASDEELQQLRAQLARLEGVPPDTA